MRYKVLITINLKNIPLENVQGKVQLYHRSNEPGQFSLFCDVDLGVKACDRRDTNVCCLVQKDPSICIISGSGMTTTAMSSGQLLFNWPKAPVKEVKEKSYNFPEIRDPQTHVSIDRGPLIPLIPNKPCYLEVKLGQSALYTFCTTGLDNVVLTIRFPNRTIEKRGSDCLHERYRPAVQHPLPSLTFQYRDACGHHQSYLCHIACEKPFNYSLRVNGQLISPSRELCELYLELDNNTLTFCCSDLLSQCQAIIMTKRSQFSGHGCVSMYVTGQTSDLYHFSYSLCGQQGPTLVLCNAFLAAETGLPQDSLFIVYIIGFLLGAAMVISPIAIWIFYRGRMLHGHRSTRLKSIMRRHSAQAGRSKRPRPEQVTFAPNPKRIVYYID